MQGTPTLPRLYLDLYLPIYHLGVQNLIFTQYSYGKTTFKIVENGVTLFEEEVVTIRGLYTKVSP